MLARHFEVAGDEERALSYYSQAGSQAAGKYANAEAADHYGQALKIATRRLPEGAPLGPIHDLFMRRGRAMELSSRHDQALENYSDLEALARERSDQRLELAGLIARMTLHCVPSPVFDPVKAQALADGALSLARQLDDPAAEAKTLWNLLLVGYFTNQTQPALEYGERSLALARAHDLRQQTAYTLNDLARVYVSVGQMGRCLDMLAEARQLWRQQDNLPMLADNLATAGGFYFLLGEYDQALAVSDEACAISRSIGNIAGQVAVRFVAGLIYLERGELDRAMAAMRESIRLLDIGGDLGGMVAEYADLGWSYGVAGQAATGLKYARQAWIAAERLPLMRPWAAAVLARLHLELGDLASAKAALADGYRDFDPTGFMGSTIMISLADAEVALSECDFDRVLERCEEVLGAQQLLGARGMQAEVLYSKALALLGQGLAEAGRATLHQARSPFACSAHCRIHRWPGRLGRTAPVVSRFAAGSGRARIAVERRA